MHRSSPACRPLVGRGRGARHGARARRGYELRNRPSVSRGRSRNRRSICSSVTSRLRVTPPTLSCSRVARDDRRVASSRLSWRSAPRGVMTVGGRRVDHRDRVVVLVGDIDGMGRVIHCDRERGLSDRDRRRRLTATTRVASVTIASARSWLPLRRPSGQVAGASAFAPRGCRRRSPSRASTGRPVVRDCRRDPGIAEDFCIDAIAS